MWPPDRSKFARLTNATYAVETNVVIDGSFAPDHIYHDSAYFQAPPVGIVVCTNFAIKTLEYRSGYTTGMRGRFYVQVGCAFTLCGGPRPVVFGGYQGGWTAFVLGTNATLAFTGASIVLDAFNATGYDGGAAGYHVAGGNGGYVDFANPASTITVGQPPTNIFRGAVCVGTHRLRVHENQTWLNPSGAGFIEIAPVNGRRVIDTLGGGALSNLANAALRFVNLYSIQLANNDYFIPPGVYQGFSIRGYHTSAGTPNRYNLQGDVILTGGAVVFADVGGTSNAVQSDYSIVFERATGFDGYMPAEVVLRGHTLTCGRGILLQRDGGSTGGGVAAVNAAGSVLNIGGDLVYYDVNYFAGHIGTNAALEEARRIGVYGDTGTVINLCGSFRSNARSSTRGNGLCLSTVNLIGGTRESPSTFEVCADPTNDFVPATYAIGALNVGTSASAKAYVRLVNDSVNDNDATNLFKTKTGEVLLAKGLTIGPGSTLDCAGLRVKVGTNSLSVYGDGTLDLNSGSLFSGPMVCSNFFGVGDQSVGWNLFKTRVVDSANRGWVFEAAYVESTGRTYWRSVAMTRGSLIAVW